MRTEETTAAPLTREDIERIRPGVHIRREWFGRWSDWQRVRAIYARDEDQKGLLFVCGYTHWTKGGDMPFSAKQGDQHIQVRKAC